MDERLKETDSKEIYVFEGEEYFLVNETNNCKKFEKVAAPGTFVIAETGPKWRTIYADEFKKKRGKRKK